MISEKPDSEPLVMMLYLHAVEPPLLPMRRHDGHQSPQRGSHLRTVHYLVVRPAIEPQVHQERLPPLLPSADIAVLLAETGE